MFSGFAHHDACSIQYSSQWLSRGICCGCLRVGQRFSVLLTLVLFTLLPLSQLLLSQLLLSQLLFSQLSLFQLLLSLLLLSLGFRCRDDLSVL